MKNKITANTGLKLASLLFSFLLWMAVNNMNDPTIDRSFTNVPVKLLNTELITDSGRIYEVLDGTAVIDKVTVWAPRSVISSLSSSNIVATADVGELSSLDTISIKLSTNLYGNDVERIKGSIDTVKLNIENKRTKTLALKTTVSGSVEDGYLLGDIVPNQNLVRISGPESVVNQVVKAAIDVPVTGFTSDISDNAEIKLYDSEDHLVQDSRIEQNIKSVGVKVTIYRTTEVPVYFSVIGSPAYGYRTVGEPEGSISSINIAGRESIIRNINAIEVPAEVIDISDCTEDYQVEIDIRNYLPDNTFLADSSQSRITVTVAIEPDEAKELEVHKDRIEVTNVPSGYKATISEFEENVTINVRGLSEEIAGLRSSDMRGYVDVGKWMKDEEITEVTEGYYQVEIDFGLPDNVTIEEPVMVTMHLSRLED